MPDFVLAATEALEQERLNLGQRIGEPTLVEGGGTRNRQRLTTQLPLRQ